MKKKTKEIKICPLLDENCIGDKCAIFNEKFGRCEIGLIAYNLYLLASALRERPEVEGK